MNAAQELRHRLRWNLRSAIPWMLGSLVLAIGGAMPMLSRDTPNTGIVEPQAWSLLPLLAVPYGVVVIASSIQADSPIDPSAFFRGRPLRWWTLPLVKPLTMFLTLVAPPMAVVLVAHTLWRSDAHTALRAAWGILLVQGGILLAVWCAAACTRHVMTAVGFLVLVYASLFIAAPITASLDTLPLRPLGMVAVIAALIGTVGLYWRNQPPRRAQVALMGLASVGLSLVTGPRRQPQVRPFSPYPVATNLAVAVDSLERTADGLLRIAYHIDAPDSVDRIVVSNARIELGSVPVAVVDGTRPNSQTPLRVVRVTDNRRRPGLRVLGPDRSVLGVEPTGVSVNVHPQDVQPPGMTLETNGRRRFDGVLVAALTDLRVLDTLDMRVTIPVSTFRLRMLARTTLFESTIWQGSGTRVALLAPDRRRGRSAWHLRVTTIAPMGAGSIAEVLGAYEVEPLSGLNRTPWRFDRQQTSRSTGPFVALGASREEVSVGIRAADGEMRLGDSVVVRLRIDEHRQQLRLRVPARRP